MRNVGDGRLVCAVKKLGIGIQECYKGVQRRKLTYQSFSQLCNFCPLQYMRERMRLIFIYYMIMHAFFTKQFKIDGQANFNHQQISFLNFNVLASQNAIGKIQYYIVTRVIKSLLWCNQFETDTESCTFSRSILFSRNFLNHYTAYYTC